MRYVKLTDLEHLKKIHDKFIVNKNNLPLYEKQGHLHQSFPGSFTGSLTPVEYFYDPFTRKQRSKLSIGIIYSLSSKHQNKIFL